MISTSSYYSSDYLLPTSQFPEKLGVVINNSPRQSFDDNASKVLLGDQLTSPHKISHSEEAAEVGAPQGLSIPRGLSGGLGNNMFPIIMANYEDNTPALIRFETIAGYMYVVRADSQALVRRRAPSTLAFFDHLGNGAVFGENGSTRIQYNQHEGIWLEPPMGPPRHWKWHCMDEDSYRMKKCAIEDTRLVPLDMGIFEGGRESPDDASYYYDRDRRDSARKRLNSKSSTGNLIKKSKRLRSRTVLGDTIENQTVHVPVHIYIAKRNELPFRIMKINDQFALRITNQENIKLIFEQHGVNLKVNVGMFMNPRNILGLVSNPADKISIGDALILGDNSLHDDINNSLKKSKNIHRKMEERRHKLYGPSYEDNIRARWYLQSKLPEVHSTQCRHNHTCLISCSTSDDCSV